MTSATPSRRERLRAATVEEILGTARQLLVSDGPTAVSLRAIGREMGMTAPALYRYFDSLDILLEALVAGFYDECVAHLRQRVEACAADDHAGRLAAACRGFRSWSTAHPAEFTMMFASHAGGADHDDSGPAHAAGMRFAAAFLDLFVALWQHTPFPTPARVEPALAAQFQGFLDLTGAPLPLGAVHVFTSCWIRLYGMVALEVYGHLLLADATPMFEAELASVAGLLNLELQPVAGGS